MKVALVTLFPEMFAALTRLWYQWAGNQTGLAGCGHFLIRDPIPVIVIRQ